MVGAAVLLALLGLYFTRKVVAREVLAAWLGSQGVASAIVVHDFGFGRFAAQLRAGPPRAPDFAVDEATVTYGLRGLNLEVRSVTLSHPVLRARLQNGRLSLGALDPLVDKFLRKQARPDQPQPSIEIRGGRLLLATDYGVVQLTGDAVIKDGRVLALTARSDPARLQGADFTADLGSGSAILRTSGDQLHVLLDAPFASLRTATATASSGDFKLDGEATYPDVKARRLDGALAFRMNLGSDRLQLGRATLHRARIVSQFQGRVAGWNGALNAHGAVATDIRGATAAGGGTRVGAIRASIRAEDLRWAHGDVDTFSATPRLTMTAQDLTRGGLRLSDFRLTGGGPMMLDASGLRASVSGDLEARGSWTGLGPIRAADAPELVRLKRAARGFQITAPRVAADFRAAGWRLALPQAVQVRTDSGARVTLAARGEMPALSRDGGAFSLAARGGGLPRVDLDVVRLQWGADGLAAHGEAKLSGAFGPIQGGSVEGSGTLRVSGGVVNFIADRCAQVSAQDVVLGANDVERFNARLCPWDGPMFSLAGGHWRIRARARDLTAGVRPVQARIAGGAGSVTVDQAAGQLAVRAELHEATIIDDVREPRFNPMRIEAAAKFASGRWSADFKLSTPTARPIAVGALWHELRNASGGLTVDTGELTFAASGLQPEQLSSLARPLGSDVEGRAQFTGRVDWTPAGVTSGGTLSVPSLDFQSAAGKVSGLNGTLIFDNLAPLIAAPGQRFSAHSLAAIVPITDISAGVGLDAQTLIVAGGEAAVGGGHVRIESLRIPLVANAPMTGVLRLDGVQLHDLVRASPFGDRVTLDASVSGRVPFQSDAGKVRIADAELHAVQPGRLSINRRALTAITATGSVSGPAAPSAPVAANDTFTDFAYQAMENLAFDKLDATIASRDDGRLGILAHVVGRHDPPQHQEITLSLFDLIGRKFLKRPLPLPSDTRVDLTLDTTLNLDDLVADYADYQRLRSSRAVQPAAAITETKPLETRR